MNIGISFLPPGGAISAFSSGRLQASVRLGEVLRQLGHSVTLVSLGKERWFSDCLEEKDDWKVCLLEECAEPFDIFIDMYGNIQGSLRRRLGRRVILMIRDEMSMALRENVIYENDRRVFSFDGVDCIWTAREGDAEILRVLSKKPVEVIPFYWSPWHLVGAESSGEYDESWRVYIMENNTRVNSSCVPSLMMAEDLIKGGSVEKVYVLNADRLVENDYFKVNLKGSLTEGLYEFCGRLKTVDIALNERSCVLSHLRFDDQVPKAALLDLVWLGVPVIHNSQWLRDFGHGYEELYYDAGSAGEAFDRLCHGWDCSNERRLALTQRFSCIDAEKWQNALQCGSVPAVKSATSPEPFIIQFSDFWADYNPEYNFFTLLFTEALLSIADGRRVVGVGEGFCGPRPANLVVCGPYSERWRKLDPRIPKICFTGELSQPVYGDGIFLNIGFFQNGYGFANTGVNYCRLPLWAASINWFGADNGRLVNPTLIDIDECLAEHHDVASREKFCAFVVSNPSNKVRNDAFQTLNQYKKVDSAGGLFNNMGNGLFAGQGGGGGERRKVEFFKDYKFALVYENSSWNGYTTEKLFHAKVAGCLPLYWGDPIAAQDFHPYGYINLTGKEDQLLDIVRGLEENPEAMEAKAREPALSIDKMDELRGVLAMIAKYSLDYIFPSEKEHWQQLPQALGARSTAEAQGLAERRLAVGAEVGPLVVQPEMTEEFGRKVKDMLFVTSASESDMGDLYLWLSHMNSIAVSTKGEYRLYWTGSEDSRRLRYMKEMYDWITIICVDKFSLAQQEADRLICYMSPRTVLVNNPFYMCSVADQKGACLLKHRDRLVDDGSAEAMDDVIIVKGCLNETQRIFADNFIGFSSLEESRLGGKAFYCWESGAFKYKQPFLAGISECSIINLKRRPDRLQRFAKENRSVSHRVKVVDAIDGKRLKLTPHIQRLFEGGSFGWKKGVIGCNLSHLSVWYGLAHSNQFIENMLVLEDDVKFVDGWERQVEKAMSVVPTDYDVLYLGGILPPNKAMWPHVRAPVNSCWDRVSKNTAFGHAEPTAYFHFCAYAYILSKRGAEKLLDGIKREGGYKCVSDHQILNPANNMNVYVMNPIVAGCYQEEDPVYMATNFNATNKEHTYDSDLWTNSDCFTPERSKVPLDVCEVMRELEGDALLAEALAPVVPRVAVSPPVVFLSENGTHSYEKEWLSDIIGAPMDIARVIDTEEKAKDIMTTGASHLLVIYRQASCKEVEMLEKVMDIAEQRGKQLIVVHLSDEHRQNDISFYEDAVISFVIRNYIRSDISATIKKKVLTIPLGWYRRGGGKMANLTDRELVWSFHGTDWFNRKKMLDVLSEVKPHSLHVRNSWEEQGTSRDKYIEDIMNSIVVPCPEGNNAESFRIYEALEAGCLPLLVDEGRNPEFYPWLQAALPSIIVTRSWEDSLRLFKMWAEEPAKVTERHVALMAEWSRWKSHLRNVVKKFIFWA
jgi:GR25 family glycosyltransferase involved in LPS biosynthesis